MNTKTMPLFAAVFAAITASAEVPAWMSISCGVEQSWPVAEWTGASAGAKVKVSGLPSGMKYKNGVVTGAPARDRDTTVKITVTGPGRTSTVHKVALDVEDLPDWAVGEFAGAAINADGGYDASVTMKVTAAGKVSGKFNVDGTAWTIKANSLADAELDRDGEARAITIVADAKAGRQVRKVVIELTEAQEAGSILPDSDLATMEGGIYSIDAAGNPSEELASLTLHRLPWKDKDDDDAHRLLSACAGTHAATAIYGDEEVDTTLKLDKKGNVKGSAVVYDFGKKRKVSFSTSAIAVGDKLVAVAVVPANLKKGHPALTVEHEFEAGAPAAKPSSGSHAQDPSGSATTGSGTGWYAGTYKGTLKHFEHDWDDDRRRWENKTEHGTMTLTVTAAGTATATVAYTNGDRDRYVYSKAVKIDGESATFLIDDDRVMDEAITVSIVKDASTGRKKAVIDCKVYDDRSKTEYDTYSGILN